MMKHNKVRRAGVPPSFSCLSLCLLVVFAFGGINAQYLMANVQTQLQGGMKGDPAFGDLFGSSIAFNGNGTAPHNKKELFIGAPYAWGEANNTRNAGRTYFYTQAYGTWIPSPSQPPRRDTTGTTAYNKLSGGTHLSSDNEWMFVPEGGTPLDQADSTKKDNSGCIIAFRRDRQTGKWKFHQKIDNPDGVSTDTEFGWSLSYTWKDLGGDDGPSHREEELTIQNSNQMETRAEGNGGWLLVGGKKTNKVWFYRFAVGDQRWILRRTIDVSGGGGVKGPVTVAIDGRWAFIQKPVDISTGTNGEVFVYRRRVDQWRLEQTLRGIENSGTNKSATGDLFGASIVVDSKHAVIGAPGDASATNQNQNPEGRSTPPAPPQQKGAVYFFKLNQRTEDDWLLMTKQISPEQPSFLFGLDVCLWEDTALVADPGRTGLDGNERQGALQVFLLDSDSWNPAFLALEDPNGRAYDYLSSCAMTSEHFAAGTNRMAPLRVLKNPIGLLGPGLPGRVVVWQREDAKK